MMGVAVAGSVGGCASATEPDIQFRSDALRSAAAGDWDDIDSAVIWGGNAAEWVVHKWWSTDPDTRMYELRNPAGVSAMLRLHRSGAAAGGQIEMTASVGPLGNAAAEGRLVASIEWRLSQLRGVDAAEFK